MAPLEVFCHGNYPLRLPYEKSLYIWTFYDPNSIEGFRAAAEIGVEGIEADIYFSKNKKPIINHPGSLKLDPRRLDWRQIQEIYPQIPDLDDLLIFLLKYPGLKCFLDLKDDSLELVEVIVKKLGYYNLRDRVFLTASRAKIGFLGLYSDGRMLSYAKSLDPKIKTHLIDIFPTNLAKTGKKLGADIISFGWFNDSLLSQLLFLVIFKTGLKNIKEEVAKAQNQGLLVFGGVTDTVLDVEYFIKVGVDGIVSNNPLKALETVKK